MRLQPVRPTQIAATAAAIVGLVQARVIPQPQQLTLWWTRHRDLIPRYLGEYIDGRHYTAYGDKVAQLTREGRYDEAERLLLRICDAIES